MAIGCTWTKTSKRRSTALMQQDYHMADAKKMVEGWVFGEGAVMYPYLYDDDGKRMLAGAYPVGYSRWLPGVFKWYALVAKHGRS